MRNSKRNAKIVEKKILEIKTNLSNEKDFEKIVKSMLMIVNVEFVINVILFDENQKFLINSFDVKNHVLFDDDSVVSCERHQTEKFRKDIARRNEIDINDVSSILNLNYFD